MISPLLNYFIKASIGWKDYSIIDREIAELLQAEDSTDEFHLVKIDNDLFQLWLTERWKRKDEIEKAMTEANKRIINEQVEKYNHAMTYLTTTGNLSEADAREMLSVPLIRQKFGLI